MKLPAFQFVAVCPLLLVLLLVITKKSPAPLSLHAFLTYLYKFIRSPLSLCFSRIKSPALSAFPHKRDAPVP